MPTKKAAPKKSVKEKTIITTIAGKVGNFAGGLVAGKNHLLEMAGDAIDSVKSTFQDITTKSKKAPAKKTRKPTAKKAVKKSAPPVAEKTAKVVVRKPSAAPRKPTGKVVKKTSAKK